MSCESEIDLKLWSALMVSREKGGPTKISISRATAIAQKNYPGITEAEIRSIVTLSKALELSGDDIVLSSAVTDLL